jgi:hypothetical protein
MPPSASTVRAAIPRRRNPALLAKLPPPKLPIFRNVVAHPPAPFAVPQKAKQGEKGKALDVQVRILRFRSLRHVSRVGR